MSLMLRQIQRLKLEAEPDLNQAHQPRLKPLETNTGKHNGRTRNLAACNSTTLLLTHFTMSLYRTLRNLQKEGFKAWWRQLQYIGDAKSGTFVGADQCVQILQEVHL